MERNTNWVWKVLEVVGVVTTSTYVEDRIHDIVKELDKLQMYVDRTRDKLHVLTRFVEKQEDPFPFISTECIRRSGIRRKSVKKK